ncbi:MAG: hypothetical protein CMH57_08335 [Myxococcales bacterium]|nr:hypothetical protein [Myxococcales bacterium]
MTLRDPMSLRAHPIRTTRAATLSAALLVGLLLATGCASPPPPKPPPAPAPEPAADPDPPIGTTPTKSSRGQIVAVDTNDASYQKGEALERAAQRYGEEVEELFAQNQAAINQCYLKELKKNPSLGGQIIVQLLVLPGGKLEGEPVFASNTLNNAKVERCIAGILTQMSYPEPYNDEYAEIERLLRFGAF